MVALTSDSRSSVSNLRRCSISTKVERVVGRIVEVREFGAIVELPGSQSGLLHVSRLAGGSRRSHDRRLSQLNPGDSVAVDIVEIKREGKRTKISLSELWRDDDVLTGLQSGDKVSAVVVHKLDFGLVVCIADGVAAGYDGFVHVSELAGATRVDQEKKLGFAALGDRLELEVLRVANSARGELSIKLSESAAVVGEKLSGSYAVGTTHTGKVVRRVQGGFVVSFGDFSGFLPEKELGGASASSIRVGGRVKSKILAIGGDRSITLTRKGL